MTIDVDQLFQALGDPTRRAILAHLVTGPRSVSGLAAPLSITLTAVTQHLHVLEAAGLVRTEKQGRIRVCCIDTPGFAALEEWLRWHRSPLERSLDRLGQMLGETGEK